MLEKKQDATGRRPSGFTPESGGLASEYARELGWGMSEDDRTRAPREKQKYDGGVSDDDTADEFAESAAGNNDPQPKSVKTKLGSGRQKRSPALPGTDRA